MKHRILVALAGAGVAAILAALMNVSVMAQTQASGTPATGTNRPNVPATPWGDPDLQGVWTLNDMHGVPLERPAATADKSELTKAEAAARRERATQAGIWGYDREWRDTALGFVKTSPSNQLSLIVDPPDGRMPPLTPEGQKRTAERAAKGSGLIEGSSEALRPGIWATDLDPYVRCITRGLPNMWVPLGYNNGVQIVQGPGTVVVTKEMIHEARVISLDRNADLGPKLTQWLGDSRGRWEGDTLVVEVTNLNGQVDFRGASRNLRLTERYRRIDPETIEYRVTIDDPKTWTKPWTMSLSMKKDDAQYELVEYSCHEGNYGLVNILSGARADEKRAAQKTVKP
jgi:hypothetical protein